MAQAIQPDEVHIWLAALDNRDLTSLAALLSPDERERAARLRAGTVRDHFVMGRGLLRQLLAELLSCKSTAIHFVYSPSGKPSLDPEHHTTLRFNLSHSAGIALYALTLDRELGIDVEQVHPLHAQDLIAAQVFPPDAIHALHAVEESRRAALFFELWTRFEAYLKATGTGFLRPQDMTDDLHRWTFHQWWPVEGIAAALVVEGTGWRLVDRGAF